MPGSLPAEEESHLMAPSDSFPVPRTAPGVGCQEERGWAPGPPSPPLQLCVSEDVICPLPPQLEQQQKLVIESPQG